MKVLVVIAVALVLARPPVFTKVTALYNIRRGGLSLGFRRPYAFYLARFGELLKTDCNLFVFGDAQLEAFVWARRQPHNTVFLRRSLDDLNKMWFSPIIENIRQKYVASPNIGRDFPQMEEHLQCA